MHELWSTFQSYAHTSHYLNFQSISTMHSNFITIVTYIELLETLSFTFVIILIDSILHRIINQFMILFS